MISRVRLAQLVAALGMLVLTACGAASATAPSATRSAGAPAHDATPCGYSVADAKC